MVSKVKLQQQYCFMKEELMAENEDWMEEITETCSSVKAFSELIAQRVTAADLIA